MFRGVTKSELNQATMIEALQQYFDKRLAEGVPRNHVIKIECETNYNTNQQSFRVVFAETIAPEVMAAEPTVG